MERKIACCGYRCDLCPAFKENITGEQDQQEVSDGWYKYYGFRIPPDEICCDGCLAENCDNPRLIDADCAVRPCSQRRGLPNCAHCDEYICGKLAKKIVDFDEITRKQSGEIPPEDRARFLEPYEGKKVLDTIRKSAGK